MASEKRIYNTIRGNVGQVITGDHASVEQVNHHYAAPDPADPLGRAVKALTDAIESAEGLPDRAAARATVAEVSKELPHGDRHRARELLRGLLTRTAEVATVSAAVTAVLQLLKT